MKLKEPESVGDFIKIVFWIVLIGIILACL